MRTALGVIAGFVVWSVLWLCTNFALRAAGVLPATPTEPVRDAMPVLALLLASIICSIVAGYVAARLAHVPAAAPILGILLLAVGIAVQLQYWKLMPTWYSIAFLVLILPMTVAGGRMAARDGMTHPAAIGA